MSLILLLKISSILLTGFFTAYGLLNPYKSPSGALTPQGKLALRGSIISTIITLIIFLSDNQPKDDPHEPEIFPLTNLTVEVISEEQYSDFKITHPEYYRELRNLYERTSNRYLNNNLAVFNDSVSAHYDSTGRIDRFEYNPTDQYKNVFANDEFENLYEVYVNKTIIDFRFRLHDDDADTNEINIDKNSYDLILSKDQIGFNHYDIFPPTYYIKIVKKYRLNFEYNKGTIKSFKQLSKCSVLYHSNDEDLKKIIIRNGNGQETESDPESIKFVPDLKSGQHQYFVMFKFNPLQ